MKLILFFRHIKIKFDKYNAQFALKIKINDICKRFIKKLK